MLRLAPLVNQHA